MNSPEIEEKIKIFNKKHANPYALCYLSEYYVNKSVTIDGAFTIPDLKELIKELEVIL